jgi:DnaJ-class molecular chaperone
MSLTVETKKRCKHCDGRGTLANGCPDAFGVETEKCNACKGKGYVMRVEAKSPTPPYVMVVRPPHTPATFYLEAA